MGGVVYEWNLGSGVYRFDKLNTMNLSAASL